MISIAALWILMIIMAGWQVPRLLKQNRNKEIIVFLAIWLSASIYGSLVLSDITLISPFDLIIVFFEDIFYSFLNSLFS